MNDLLYFSPALFLFRFVHLVRTCPTHLTRPFHTTHTNNWATFGKPRMPLLRETKLSELATSESAILIGIPRDAVASELAWLCVTFFVVRIFQVSNANDIYVAHVRNFPRMFRFTNLFHQVRTDPIPTTVVKPFISITSFPQCSPYSCTEVRTSSLFILLFPSHHRLGILSII